MLPLAIHETALRNLGADDERLSELESALAGAPPGTMVGRVSRVDRGRFQQLTPLGSYPVDTTGVAPVGVGDWCTIIEVDDTPNSDSNFALHRLLSRRSSLVRQSSGNRTEVQVLASNIDSVMVV